MKTKNQLFNPELFDVVVISKDDNEMKMYHFDSFQKALFLHNKKVKDGHICKIYNRLETLLLVYESISKLN